MHKIQYVANAQLNQFYRDYNTARKQTKVGAIITMENTSTEPVPGHYGTSIFSANTRSERQSFWRLHLSQGTSKRKVAAHRGRDR